MRKEVFLALALLLLAGCTGVRVKDCGTDFKCFLTEMNKNCSPAKVQYIESGINASFETTGTAGPASYMAVRSVGGLVCKTNVKINDVQRTKLMDDETWGQVSSAIPILKLTEMTCNISPRTAEILYARQNILLATETLKTCSGSLLDLITMYMGDSINDTVIEDDSNNTSTVFPPDVPLPNVTSKSSLCALSDALVYMYVKGETQGDIHGDVTTAGHEEAIMVLDLNRSIISPRDVASGLPTGKRQHKPVTITKRIDKSSPLLMRALADNENLEEVMIKVYGNDRTGKLMHCYTILLENAHISSIKQYMNPPNLTSLSGDHLEEVSFTYGKITWTYEDGGITSEDDWETPIV